MKQAFLREIGLRRFHNACLPKPHLGYNAEAVAINDAEEIAGDYYPPSTIAGSRVFVSRNGSFQDLGTYGDVPFPRAINDAGAIVGNAYGAGPWINSGAGFADLNTLIPQNARWDLQSATGINDRGQIVGSGLLNGQPAMYLLTPTNVPEPSCASLALAAIALCAAYRARARAL